MRNGDGDSVVGTDEVQATRMSRINNQKNERIKQTSSSRHSVRGPPTRVVQASRAIAPQRTLRWVHGPPARVVQASHAISPQRTLRWVHGPPARVVQASHAIAPQRTLRWVRGPPARVVQVAAGTDHFPRFPTHFYHLSPHPTALAHRPVDPSTRAQRRYYYPQHHQYPAD